MQILAQIVPDFKAILISLQDPKTTASYYVLCMIQNDLIGSSRTIQANGLRKFKRKGQAC